MARWIEMQKDPLRGALNTNYFVLPPNKNLGGVHLMRVPRQNDVIWKSLKDEYAGIGFLGPGRGSFTLRSPVEQMNFSYKAANLGLRILQPTAMDNGLIHLPFLSHAVPIDRFLKTATNEQAQKVINRFYFDLWRAHNFDVVYGDRWPPNILVDNNLEVYNIDTDLKIEGPTRMEFEAAQTAYYLLKTSSVDMIPLLARLLCKPQSLDMAWVELYLRGHARYFEEVESKGGEEQIELLISTIESNRANK